MDSINHLELKSIVDFLQRLEGSELQKISGPLKSLCFHFWDSGPMVLIANCLNQKPFVSYTEDKKQLLDFIKNRTEQRPLSLFIKAHFLKQSVTKVKVHDRHARVFEIHFDNESVLEFRLFSGGGNIGAFKGDKSVFLRKPQVLKEESSQDYMPDLVRSPQVVFEQAFEALKCFRSKEQKAASNDSEKLKIAKEKIEKALKNLNQGLYQKLASSLEQNKTLEPELRELYKENLTKRENIEWAYKQSKVSEQKKQRLEERLESISKNFTVSARAENRASKNIKSKGVRHELSDKITLRCGRSAKENLDLLRASKPWHIWMHLTDYPSGHLIIDMPKANKLNLGDLEKAAYFLFLKGAPKKLLNSPTQKFEVMFTECRYVKAQKKNKGLVTTQKHKSMALTWKSEYMHIF